MFKKFMRLWVFVLAVTFSMSLANSQFAAAQQERYHGFLIDSQAPIGTSWRAVRSTPLWPLPQDSGFARKLTVPGGGIMRAISGFTPTATGVYIQVRYNGVIGWVDERDISRASGGGGGGAPSAPPSNIASGVEYSVTNVNNWASLRSTPSTQSARLARVPRNASVFTTGQRVRAGGMTWLSVSFNNQRGWMPTRFLRQGGGFVDNGGNTGGNQGTSGNDYPVGNYRVVNVNNWASLRRGASRSSQQLSQVSLGNTVYHGGERRWSGGELWLRVTFRGVPGWMPVQYLRLN